MTKYRVGNSGLDVLMVNANRPGRAAQKYADGKELQPNSLVSVESPGGRSWRYVVGHAGSVRRIKGGCLDLED